MPCPHPSSEDRWCHSLELMGWHSWQSPGMPPVAQGTGESQSWGSGGPGSSGASPDKAHSSHLVTGALCLAAPALRTLAATSLAVYSSSCVLLLARPPPQSQTRHFRTCPNSRCRKGLIQLVPLSPACPGASRQSPSPVLPTEGMVGCWQDPSSCSCCWQTPASFTSAFGPFPPSDNRRPLWALPLVTVRPSSAVAAGSGQGHAHGVDSPSARVTRISTSPSFILVTAATASSVPCAGHSYCASRTGRIRSGYSLESRAMPGGEKSWKISNLVVGSLARCCWVMPFDPVGTCCSEDS